MPSFDNLALNEASAPLVSAWRAALEEAGPASSLLLQDVANNCPTDLADHFYAVMLDDPRATRFLSHDQVRNRLKPAMQRWLNQLLHAQPDDVEELIAAQRVIGDVHARIGIPVDLVTRGTRVLKQQLFKRIISQASCPQIAFSAIGSLSTSFDTALESMTQAYSNARERSSRTDATYRLFSLMQNASTERERQRALLLDWENSLLYAIASQSGATTPDALANSDFGLWFTHKGIPSFGDSSETRGISGLMDQVDQLLPGFAEQSLPHETRFSAFQTIRGHLAQIRNLLGMLFERVGELDAGRDSLTNLLNRRFLPTVLRREIDLSSKSGKPFALLLLDLDHFKAINDRYGHEGGDRALQHVAATLTQFTRGSDYLFRYGGEEFLVVLVSVTESQALVIAENLCKRIAMSPVPLGGNERLQITASIGVSVHDNHPDYERLVGRADAAMYQAKKLGRNRVILADDNTPVPPGIRQIEQRNS
jgi:diguanylate cyclase